MLPSFPSGARVAFIGDSITAANLTLPRVIHAYKELCLSSGIRFFNCGVAGGTAAFALKSYDTDIARYAPTHAVVSFGINDSNRHYLLNPRSPNRLAMLEASFEGYKKSLRALIERLLSDGVQVILCTPVPYDEYTVSDEPALRGGFALMLGYAEYVRGLARELGVTLYDQHAILSEELSSDNIISEDHIHPSEHGYFVLARKFLREQGIAIGAEVPIPEYFAEWHSRVARLRKVLAAECMIIPDFNAPTEEKLRIMKEKIEREDWGQPVFESFIRHYVEDKPNEEWLYSEIDRLYEKDIF